MKNVKRIFALLLCLALAVTCFAGCHKKGEIAVKIGDYKLTSGYYACALVQADTEAREKVDESLTEKGKDTSDVKYIKQKIDGKDYETWVLDRAKEMIRLNIGYKALCEEKGYKLEDSEVQTSTEYANTYWDSYGYSQLFEPNGVSKETFLEFTKDGYYEEVYFQKTYGKEGVTPVSEENVNKTLSEHYVLANVLEIALAGDETADNETKQKLDNYKAEIESGKKTFKNVFDEYTAETSGEDATATETATTDTTASETASTDTVATETSDTPVQKDLNAKLLGDKETDNESEYYEVVKGMAVGEVKVHKTETNYVLLVKADPLADPYYAYSYNDTLRRLFVGKDNFKKEALDYLDKKFKTEFIKSSTKQFKVKNIEYPETK